MRDFERPARLDRVTGFTLFELLVVILIIGVMLTFAVLSIGSRALDDRLETEARRLQQLLVLAADEAVLHGAEVGFRQTVEGYDFLTPDPTSPVGTLVWMPVTDDPALRARRIEEPFFLELRVEDRPVLPADSATGGQSPVPQVLLSSSGETTAFSLRIRARNYGPYFLLQSNLMGQMTLERKDAT